MNINLVFTIPKINLTEWFERLLIVRPLQIELIEGGQ